MSVLAAAALPACASPSQGNNCDGRVDIDPDAGAAAPTVVFSPDGLPEARVRVEVERTDHEFSCALVGVTQLPSDEGVLLVAQGNGGLVVTGQGIPIATEYILVDVTLKVVQTIDNIPPEDTANHASERQGHYAIGVNAGWTVVNGVDVDTPVSFENFSP